MLFFFFFSFSLTQSLAPSVYIYLSLDVSRTNRDALLLSDIIYNSEARQEAHLGFVIAPVIINSLGPNLRTPWLHYIYSPTQTCRIEIKKNNTHRNILDEAKIYKREKQKNFSTRQNYFFAYIYIIMAPHETHVKLTIKYRSFLMIKKTIITIQRYLYFYLVFLLIFRCVCQLFHRVLRHLYIYNIKVHPVPIKDSPAIWFERKDRSN